VKGVGGERELLAQIETRRELTDCILALGNLRRFGRMQQPCGERVLSRRARCLRDQLIQAAGAEDVEIACRYVWDLENAGPCRRDPPTDH
jgi:hypothetical protein